MIIALDSATGYIFEMDAHLHDAHTDLAFCPTREKPFGKLHSLTRQEGETQFFINTYFVDTQKFIF